MTSSKVVLLSVVLSVAASALTTALLTPSNDRVRSSQQTVESHAVASPGEWLPVGAEPNAEAIAQLQDKVRGIEQRLAAAGSAPPARTREAALQDLLAITQGERQLAIEDLFKELSALGNDAVPDIVAILKSGRDQDYGGGFSIGGGKVQGYPRLRTVLIDVLRQIGTPEAQQGLVTALRGTEDVRDYRDLLLLYSRTTDEIMVKGISAMIPDLLRNEQAKSEEHAYVMGYATEWIRRHGMKDTTDLLEGIARENLSSGRVDRGTFATLIEFSPERAFALTREQYAKEGDRAFLKAASSMNMGRRDLSLAQVARYTELLLSLEPSASTRMTIYGMTPSRLCEKIDSKEARVADGRVLLEFLRKRLREETDEVPKRVLADHITQLEQALQQ
ncbi:MAG TPA: hypothetical protein VFY93_07465 [Planctomycetota bacterium]|nr:hypothetical protein [Planctomycetota bacterium]